MKDEYDEEAVRDLAKLIAKSIASKKEAFIIEGLKPYYTIKDAKIEWNQSVKLRLAEYVDWKRQFEMKLDILKHHLINTLCKELLTRGDVSSNERIPQARILRVITLAFRSVK